jgi:hypothetical protein
MPRFLLKLALFITLALTITSLAARALGSTQPLNPVLRGFTEGCEDKPQPCWYGIVPEKTTFTDSVQIMMDRKMSITTSANFGGYIGVTVIVDSIGCEVGLFRSNTDENLLVRLSFQNCSTLKLGDILNLFGAPYTVGTTLSCDFKPWEHLVPMANYWMHYPKIGSLSVNAAPDYWKWISPNDLVVSFDVVILRYNFPPPSKWEGFIPFWRYVPLHNDQVQTSSCGP